MSITPNDLLFASSYAQIVGYMPKCFEQLANALTEDNVEKIIIKKGPIFENLNNTLVKVGFMLYARNTIEHINGKDPIYYIFVNYHFCNFVIHTKAYLDAVAITLNNFYDCGYAGGDIDLKKAAFIRTLKKRRPKLANEFILRGGWIGEVVKWRDALVHRLVTPVIPIGDKSPYESGDFKAKIQLKPVPLFGIAAIRKSKRKYPRTDQDILPFCDRWISHAKVILEELCTDLSSSMYL
jgi:hypothetical protein